MMRHGNKVRVWGWILTVDTKDDSWYVLCDPAGEPVARIARQDSGRRFRQAGTNPDYTGFLAYHLQYRAPGSEEWRTWTDTAEKGDMTRPRFLEHLAEEHGHKRPPHRSADEVFDLCKQAFDEDKAKGDTERVTKKRIASVVDDHGACLSDYNRDEVNARLWRVLGRK